MKLDQLRAFLAVYENGSFTAGAATLGRTQPAVSRRVQLLEQHLGIALFERIGKSLYPTEAGRRLATEAERLLGDVARLEERVGRPGARQLRIGASTTPGLYLLPRLLGGFHRAHPEVALDCVIENTERVSELLLRNALDLGLVGGQAKAPSLLSRPVASDRILCVCGPDHPLAARPSLEAAELAGATWVVRERGSATQRQVERALAKAGVHPERRIALRGPEAIKALAREGLGIAFLSSCALEDELLNGELVALSVQGLALERTLYLVQHIDKCVSDSMRWFLDLLTERPLGSAHPRSSPARDR